LSQRADGTPRAAVFCRSATKNSSGMVRSSLAL